MTQMPRTIDLSEETFALLAQEARRNQTSPSKLAEKLIEEGLSVERTAWQAAFEELLARVHSHMSAFDAAEIKSDITAAAKEVKAARRAGRRPG
jgi:hypothetical protein